jgi:hypothetical protein
MHPPISRRTLLRGAGAGLALPLLDAMAPRPAQAKDHDEARPPVRALFYIVGGGAYVPYWSLDDNGRREPLAPQRAVEYRAKAEERNEPLNALSPTLEPLGAHKEDLLVLGGLTLVDSYQFEDGHSAEIAGLLTGAPLARDRVWCGASVDQVAARKLEGKTWIDSLVLGLNGARPGGARGIGRVYAQHYSWRSPTTPTGEERSPRAVFNRLFRGRNDSAAGQTVRNSALTSSERKSVLDLVQEEARSLSRTLGADDRRRLDEYLTAVRDVERRIEWAAKRPPPPDAPSLLGDPRFPVQVDVPEGSGVPESYIEYDRLMVDLVALAFACDATRVAVLTHGGYRSYPEVEVKRGHHDLQHHEGDPEKREDLRKVDRFNVQQFAGVLSRFKSIPDGRGTLLDNAMVMFGSGMSNGNRHARENLPILLAGRAGGTVKPGRHIDYNWKRLTPLSNLYVEMLQRLGVDVEKFGDSTGGLAHLA